ncbi:lipase [Kribbella sancticallisti]|uniref:Lipase n=1 Tax=Kribbella sancticallisti TaxID=460087 RepID=A0ABP4PUV2_9ACTN
MTNYQSFSRRRILGGGLVASLLLSSPASAQAYPLEPDFDIAVASEMKPQTIDLPGPTGRYELGTTELHLVDPARTDAAAPGGKRELMVSVWYPARPEGEIARYMPAKTAAAVDKNLSESIGAPLGTFDFAKSQTHAHLDAPARPGKHPVVLFSPGYPSSRFLNTAQVEELASQGYVVVTIDHTHEGPVEFPGGRFVPSTVNPEPTADQYRQVIDTRVADTRFVLDQIIRLAYGTNPDADERKLPAGLPKAIDLRKIGMYGFSAGGFTTAATLYADRRVAAGADLDGTLAYDRVNGPLSEVARRGLDRPFLLFGSDGSQRTKPGENHERSWAEFWQAQQGWKLNLQLPGSRPLAFSDYQFIYYDVVSKLLGDDDEMNVADQIQANIAGVVDRRRSVAAQRAYLTAFFDQTLRHEPQALLRTESPDYPEVTFVR